MSDTTSTLASRPGGRAGGRNPTRFEWAVAVAALVQLAFTAVWVARFGFAWTSPLLDAAGTGLVFAGFLIAAIVVRAVLARLGRGRRYELPGAAVDPPVLGFLMAVVATDYTWLKLLIPALNGRLWDAAFGRLDRLVCLGLDPNRVALTILEGNPRWLASSLDIMYWIWLFAGFAGGIALLTDADERTRRSGAASLAVLWLAGVWLYVAFPAVGPALVDLDLWTHVSALFPNNAGTERELLRNYLAVKNILAGTPTPVRVSFGVAAMPSLHVGLDVLFALWAARQARWWAWVWWILTGITAVTAVATGWHYVVDVLAGAALAIVVYAGVAGRRPERAAATPR